MFVNAARGCISNKSLFDQGQVLHIFVLYMKAVQANTVICDVNIYCR